MDLLIPTGVPQRFQGDNKFSFPPNEQYDGMFLLPIGTTFEF